MRETIDARGLSCPQPVVKAKQAVDEGKSEFDILVDDETAKQNLLRFADANGLRVESITVDSGAYRLHLKREGAAAADDSAAAPGTGPAGEAAGKTLLVATDRLGRGSDELGAKLMLAFLFTLTEMDVKPAAVILMQGGVRLATAEPQAVEHLQKLEGAGVTILVCGTCLDYFKLKDQVQAGRVSNMYEIVETLLGDAGVVCLS